MNALDFIGAYGMACVIVQSLSFTFFCFPHSTNPMSVETLGRVAVLDIFEVRLGGHISSASLVKNIAELP